MGSFIYQLFTPATIPEALNLEEVSEQLSLASASAHDTYAAIQELLSVTATTGINMTPYVPTVLSSYAYDSPSPIPPLADSDSLDLADPVFFGEIPAIPDLDINIETAPEPTFSRPSFNIPAPPDIDWPTFTADPPAASPMSLPTAPVVSLPDPPSIEDVIVPAPPSAAVPEFEGTAPNIDLTPPDLNYAWSETPYTSALMTAIKARIESDVATGGEGYSATVEQQIYDREQARIEAEDEKKYLDALEDSGQRGWMLPPGEVVGKVIDISDAINKRREEMNDKLIAQQTELAQRNTHLAMTTAIKVETILIGHHNNVQQRSYQAARFVIDAALEIYNTKVSAYRAQAQVFAVLAKVYEAKIRAEIVKAELYKAHIEGLKTGIEANKLKVDVYKSQLLGIKALVEMYRAQMEAGRVHAQVERTRIAGYAAQVEAYQARIAAITAQYDGYVAQVRGEVIKADMVKANAQAYKAESRAYRTRAELSLEEARATIDALRAQIQMYDAQVQKYLVDVEDVVGTAKANAQVSAALADLRVIHARFNAAARDLDAKLFNARTVEQSAIHRATATISAAEKAALTAVTEAAETGIRAAQEAATAISVAANASDTTSSSRNHRQSSLEAVTDSDRKNRDSVRNQSSTYAFQDITISTD